jgi:hypothetical protein
MGKPDQLSLVSRLDPQFRKSKQRDSIIVKAHEVSP